MGHLSKNFATLFDTIYYHCNKKKYCNKILENEIFDDKEYTVDEFYEYSKQYFERPWDFYKDFRYEGAPKLRDGVHPNENSVMKYPTRTMLFDSPIKTQWEENNLVPFRWFSNEQNRSKIILLFAPGWGRRSQSIEGKMCHRLQQNGIDTGLMTVPYQQARTPVGAYTGEYFISGNMLWTVANFRHFVAEIRLLIQYMRNFYDYVGIIGMSSGGFQAALAANSEEIDFFFPFITGAQLGSIVWHGMITNFVKEDVQKKGVDEDGLNKIWSISDQMVLGSKCKAKYRRHYISLYDRVIPATYQFKMWESLGKADLVKLECAHYSSYFFLNKVADDIATFIKQCVSTNRRIYNP